MATKVSITAPNKAGDTVRVYAQREDDQVYVWIANGPQIGWYNFDRFEGGLTSASLRNVLFGKDEK